MHDRNSQAHRAWWFPAVAVAIVAVLMWAPVMAAGVSAASADGSGAQAPFTPSVGATDQIQKFADTGAPTGGSTALASALPKRSAPVAQAAPKAVTSVRTATRTSTRTTSTVRTSTRTTTTRTSSGSELSQARAILASLIAAHPICVGATVSIGTTPGGYQAVCFYRSGRILVSPTHTASLRTILNHEIWHIIDWRDNGRIDWGEAVPR